MALTARRQAFVAEYLKCWNASEAARRAGYSEATASEQGSRLLADVNVSAEIARRKAEMLMSADEIMARLTEQGRAAYAPYIRTDGTVNIADLVLDGKAHLIKKIKFGKSGLEIEFYDVQAALALLAKARGLDRITLTGKDGGPFQHEHKPAYDLSKLSADELRTWRMLVAKAGSDGSDAPAGAGADAG